MDLADDLLSTLLLSFTGPVLFAPAMNTEMWEKPVRAAERAKRSRSDGATMIGPGEGWLSCRTRGAGRMAEPEEIVAAVRSEAVPKKASDRHFFRFFGLRSYFPCLASSSRPAPRGSTWTRCGT